MLKGTFSHVPGQIGPEKGGYADRQEVRRPQQGGLEGMSVFMREERRFPFRPEAAGDEYEHAQGYPAPVPVMERGQGAADLFLGAVTVSDCQNEPCQRLGKAPGPLPEPEYRDFPVFHGPTIAWRSRTVKERGLLTATEKKA